MIVACLIPSCCTESRGSVLDSILRLIIGSRYRNSLLASLLTKSDTATIDIIARAEDAAKIQRISDRFELGKVDKASMPTHISLPGSTNISPTTIP